MQRICSTLSEAGYAVTLVGRKLKQSLPLEKRSYQQVRLSCIFTKGKLFYAEYNIRLFFFLLFRAFDAVCAIDLDTILPAFYVTKFRRKKMVYDAHEYFTEVPEVIHRPRVKKAWEKIADHTIPHVRHCYTVGPALAGLFSERYHTSFQVVMNAPVSQELPNIEAREKDVLLYQGALNKARGIEHYIAMMPDLDMRLWLIGEGDLSEELRAMVSRLNLEQKVKFWGHMLPAEMKKITPLATIGLNVSENAGLSYYYSLNNKCFDHIHALLPTVANEFPEYVEINRKWEVMTFADATAASVKKSVLELANNKILYQKLLENCKLAAGALNWEGESRKLLKLYEEVFV